MLFRFVRAQDGFVLVLSLILLPIFLTFALLIIDVTRGNNAHGDLQSAADAMALAGARELDGEPGAIDDAHAAMGVIVNNVSMLSRSPSNSQYNLSYVKDSTSDDFDVTFLSAIPPNDTDPIQSVFSGVNDARTNSDADASYVYVAARSGGLEPLFHRILGLTDNVPVSAWAVATHTQAACQVVPIMICNPFESEGTTYSTLLNAFNEGRMHGRMLRLVKHVGGGGPSDPRVGPGNWGYLATSGNGADVLRAALAGYNPVCYSGNTVDTKPGGNTSVRQGFNTRYGMYDGSYNGTETDFPPDGNLYNYSHQVPPGNGASSPGDFAWNNEVMVQPVDGIPGAFIGQEGSGWNLRGECRTPSTTTGRGANAVTTPGNIVFRGTSNLETWQTVNYQSDVCTYNLPSDSPDAGVVSGQWWPGYWERKHPVGSNEVSWDDYLANNSLDIEDDGIRTVYPNEPSTGTIPVNLTIPSREDIHAWELAQGLALQPSGSLNGLGVPGRRELFSAIVNCKALEAAGFDFNGNTTDVPVVTYASMFTASPMEGSQDGLDFEMIDLVGYAGSTSLNEKFREESALVR